MLFEDFISKLKVFEGLRTTAYRCPSGVWTVGYGHTLGVTPNMVITGSEADCFLKFDLALIRCQLAQIHPNIIVGSGLYYSLTDFIFNVGITKYNRSTLKKVVDNIKDYFCLTENDIASLSVQFLLWTKSNGKTLRGLEKRRQWEISLLNE